MEERYNVHIIGVMESMERDNSAEAISEKIITEIFSKINEET